MIREEDELIYITNPETGQEEPFRLVKEIENEENHKTFVFYVPITDEYDTVYCAESVSLEDGSLQLRDVEEADMPFCEEVFEEIQNELEAEGIDEDIEENE